MLYVRNNIKICLGICCLFCGLQNGTQAQEQIRLSRFKGKHCSDAVTVNDKSILNMADFEKTEFKKAAFFRQVRFDSIVTFQDAVFSDRAIFNYVSFQDDAIFFRTNFKGYTSFSGTQFNSLANFEAATYDSLAGFDNTNFKETAFFGSNQHRGFTSFLQTSFYGKADFYFNRFFDRARFNAAAFLKEARFHRSEFHKDADFKHSFFGGKADFSSTWIRGRISFLNVEFNGPIDFREAIFYDSSNFVDFNSAKLIDTLFVGNLKHEIPQRFDFRLAQLLKTNNATQGSYLSHSILKDGTQIFKPKSVRLKGPGASIVLLGPVEMKIQLEQLSFVALPKEMDYFTKKFIIDATKQASFQGKEGKLQRLELDYLFAKSTIYQKKSPHQFEKYHFPHPLVIWRSFYNWTVGLGYRPFRIIWWFLAVILLFTVAYFFLMREQINSYTIADRKSPTPQWHWFSAILNCLCFSSMIFLSLRLRREILVHFTHKQKKWIAFEWTLGSGFLLLFVLGSKNGAIVLFLRRLLFG